MSKSLFIDSIFRQFQTLNWQNGISIYRSGGVLNFQAYAELSSAKVRTGIGESYDVRVKLHATGNYFQWMECTCQANRKRGEKCAHIAAFFIYLCKEKQDYLNKLRIDVGDIDYYFTVLNQPALSPAEATSLTPFDLKEKVNALRTLKSAVQDNSIETIFSHATTEIIAIDIDKDAPWVNVTAKIDEGKKLNYRFGIDDTCKLFFKTQYTKNVSSQLEKLINKSMVAKRAFEIKKNGQFGFSVNRVIYFEAKSPEQSETFENTLTSKLYVAQLPTTHWGRLGVYAPHTGYVSFEDNMSATQISRWDDYPKVANVEGDQAASMLEENFLRLKECADVIVDDTIKDTKIYKKLSLPEISLRKSVSGEYYIDASLSVDEGSKTSSSKNSILEILKARAEGKKYIQTEKGFIKLTTEFDWLKNNIQSDGQLKLSTVEFIRFHEQFGRESELTGKSEVLDKLRAGLISREDLPLPSLANTKLSLRPYQEDGLRWLWWLYSNSLGGLLADEMGLGKTHQTMALISTIAAQATNSIFLVVCPTTVIDHWLDKMKIFIPGLQCLCYHGSDRKQYLKSVANSNSPVVLVTSYGVLLRDVEILKQIKWNVIVLDEAHLVKNQASRTYKAACRIKSQMRLCLTGTPLENDLFELKNLFDYIVPNYLGTDADFKKKYLHTKDVDSDPISDMNLYRLIHPFKMRRNKIDVLTDLPEKVEDLRHCHLNPLQKKLYNETLSLKGAQLISDLKNEANPVPFIHIFSLISLLKQICDDPALIDPQYANVGSGKLDVFDELLSEAIESEQKVVVFSQYAKMINRLSARLTAKNISHVTLTGQTQNRGKLVKQFQEDKNIKVFLGSLLAGGTGIDLTSANIVIHFDRWWNAAKEDQATDRIHRIGQVKNVQVYKLLTKGTLEEKIDEIISRKKVIFERFVEQDEEVFKNLSREDLLNILSAPNENDEIDLALEHDFIIES